MDANLNALALTTLDLMGPGVADEELAEAFGDHESAALGAVYLAAFSIQSLVLHRGEPVAATISGMLLVMTVETTAEAVSANLGDLAPRSVARPGHLTEVEAALRCSAGVAAR